MGRGSIKSGEGRGRKKAGTPLPGERHVKDLLERADELKAYLESKGFEPLGQFFVFLETLKEAIVSLSRADLGRSAELLKELRNTSAGDLFRGIGEITRELHESIREIHGFLEPILTNLSEEDVQGISGRLTHVSSLVKETSERTLDLLFARQERAVADNAQFRAIARSIISGDKKNALAGLKTLKDHNEELVAELMRISELQIHADLVDQIVRKVCRVIENIEERLVDLIRRHASAHEPMEPEGLSLMGPAVPGLDTQAASSQDEVDSLLKSMGL
ncbi:MAG TPA: protein phosphatase CheZ [Deltaproteobacteria bacterium]|nr:protein phosphatase CheZ [Deltaproteobacteria bacterium]